MRTEFAVSIILYVSSFFSVRRVHCLLTSKLPEKNIDRHGHMLSFYAHTEHKLQKIILRNVEWAPARTAGMVNYIQLSPHHPPTN
jgi:hypothetical protein